MIHKRFYKSSPQCYASRKTDNFMLKWNKRKHFLRKQEHTEKSPETRWGTSGVDKGTGVAAGRQSSSFKRKWRKPVKRPCRGMHVFEMEEQPPSNLGLGIEKSNLGRWRLWRLRLHSDVKSRRSKERERARNRTTMESSDDQPTRRINFRENFISHFTVYIFFRGKWKIFFLLLLFLWKKKRRVKKAMEKSDKFKNFFNGFLIQKNDAK